MQQPRKGCVIITGATSGIGAALASVLAAQGYPLLLVGRRQADGDALAASLQALGNKASFFAADLTDRDMPEQVMMAATDAFATVHALVNNAGALSTGRADQTSDETWNTIMDINLYAVFRLSRAALPALRKSQGSIINIASDWALTGAHGALAYAVSKAAVAQLTRCMALDHANEGIRVNAVCPGDTDTPMLAAGLSGSLRASRLAELGAHIPLGRVATTADIAQATSFLLSDAASYLTGVLLPVDGGVTAG